MPPAAKKAAAAPLSDVPAKLRQIIQELGATFFERRQIMEAMLLCILAKQHGFLLGPPGTAKSLLVNELCNRFTGANYFSILLDRQLGKEELFGPIDIPLYEKSGVWERDTTGFLPWAHVALGDEVGKSGPSVLNQLLTALNERTSRNGKRVEHIPLISFFGASNELLEPELAALWDRFLVRLVVDYINEDANFEGMLLSSGGAATHTTIDLTDLQHAIDKEVPAVVVGQATIETLLKLRKELANQEIKPSDRRWKQSMRLLQASAYLNGRKVIDDDDFAVLEHVLWETPEQVKPVGQEVNKVMSELNRQAVEAERELQAIMTDVRAQVGQATQKRALFGADAKAKVDDIAKRLNDLIEKSRRQGRSTAKAEAVQEFRKAVLEEVYVVAMNMRRETAHEKAFGKS